MATEIYPGSELKGGFTVLELPTRSGSEVTGYDVWQSWVELE